MCRNWFLQRVICWEVYGRSTKLDACERIAEETEQCVNPQLIFRDRSGSAASEKSNDGFNVLFYLRAIYKISTDRPCSHSRRSVITYRANLKGLSGKPTPEKIFV